MMKAIKTYKKYFFSMKPLIANATDNTVF